MRECNPVVVVPTAAVAFGIVIFAFGPEAPLMVIASKSTLASVGGWLLQQFGKRK